MSVAPLTKEMSPGSLADTPELDYLTGSAVGEGAYTRRLTDKVLAAFNQAYATGEFEVAEILRHALDHAIRSSETVGGGRQDHPALAQADLWVDFVDARNRYKAMVDPFSDATPETVDTAMLRMKDAYRRWSES